MKDENVKIWIGLVDVYGAEVVGVETDGYGWVLDESDPLRVAKVILKKLDGGNIVSDDQLDEKVELVVEAFGRDN